MILKQKIKPSEFIPLKFIPLKFTPLEIIPLEDTLSTIRLNSSTTLQLIDSFSLSLSLSLCLSLSHTHTHRNDSLNRTPSVMYLITVLDDVRSSNRIAYPTSAPSSTPISSETRCKNNFNVDRIKRE